MKFKPPPQSQGNLPYLKLKDKESAVGVFKGDLVEYYQIYGEGIVPPGTPKAGFRFSVNFITKEGSSFVAKVFSQGRIAYNRLAHLHEEYDLEKTVVKITRKGSGKDDTEYYIDPVPPKMQPSEKGWEIINAVSLVEIPDPYGEKKEAPPKDEAPWPVEDQSIPYTDDELPF